MGRAAQTVPESPYAAWFDIDWDGRDNPGKVLVPVLGRPLAECLDAGELTVEGDQLRYYDHVLPLAPGSEGLPLPELLAASTGGSATGRSAREELNYRRFFDVTTLGRGARRGSARSLPLRTGASWPRSPTARLQGLRVDHPDGLADPRATWPGSRRRPAAAGWSSRRSSNAARNFPADWACNGTTGYDVLNQITGVFIDPAGEEPLSRLYEEKTGSADRWPTVATAAKRQVVSIRCWRRS